MNLTAKYNLNDTVWKIAQNKPKTWTPCTFCEGSPNPRSLLEEGTNIVGLDGSEKRCPECYGKGGSFIYLELEWEVTKELTIGQVELRRSVNEDDNKECYMAFETGIGGGSIHYVDSLFPSEEEAQAECDRRNKENSNAKSKPE